MEKPVFRISVRNLVEFILVCGDLDNRKGSADKEAMLKGSRLHRKIQKSMGSHYQAEVSLSRTSEYEDLFLKVEGRADGIDSQGERITIDEIKGIYQDVRKLEQPVPVHLAQAKCYAWMYAEAHELQEIRVQMTYVHLDTEEIRRFQETYTAKDLKLWYEELTKAYHRWISKRLSWTRKRNCSIRDLAFPFPYREGQKKLVSGVYHSISKKQQIFIQAPTGIGKTMSVVYPSVRALGEDKAETVFYLTAKTVTRTVAQEAFSILQKNGLLIQVLTLTAKEKICILKKPECNPDACPRAKGHNDRIREAVFELWTQETVYDRETISAYAEKWQVCPFEMALDLAVWTDAVICDYNYVFDPNAHLKRFFGENISGNYLFLIDEAHNLVERGREMYSASLSREELLRIKKQMKPLAPKLSRALGRSARQLTELKKECETYQVLPGAGAVVLSMLTAMGEMEAYLEEASPEEVPEEFLDFYFSARDFLNIAQLLDENYVVYTEQGADGEFRMRLYCVNPAKNLSTYLEKGVSTVFFSATLLPMNYYRSLLSVREDDFGMYARSPFPLENRRILIGTDVSSRYTSRGYPQYQRLAEYVARTVWQKKGNYMVFFPSYALMEEVFSVYEQEFSVPWVRTIRQTAAMTEPQREAFLEEFVEQEYTLAAFCVMGGIFSEGIDLIGDRLIGVLIVGTGLPQVGTEREILKTYYDSHGKNGFDYAYRFPGMNKVLQAAGRVIRTKEDTGIILLLDDRFRTREYRCLFPPEWEDASCCTLHTVEACWESFWKSLPGERNTC